MLVLGGFLAGNSGWRLLVLKRKYWCIAKQGESLGRREVSCMLCVWIRARDHTRVEDADIRLLRAHRLKYLERAELVDVHWEGGGTGGSGHAAFPFLVPYPYF